MLHLGDCLDILPTLPAGSVDMVLADMPYGYTDNHWDSLIPLDPLWEQYKRLIKPDGAIVLFASQPFTTVLISSYMDGFKYCWVWDKHFAANFVHAKRMPLKVCEDICVFATGGRSPRYFPQKTVRDKPIKRGGNRPNTSIPISGQASLTYGVGERVFNEKNPTNLLPYSCREQRGDHPTQKPVSLLEYLIRTYTLPGEVVLDNCMGSGSTGVACVNTGRSFIGIEKDQGYFEVAKARIEGDLFGVRHG